MSAEGQQTKSNDYNIANCVCGTPWSSAAQDGLSTDWTVAEIIRDVLLRLHRIRYSTGDGTDRKDVCPV